MWRNESFSNLRDYLTVEEEDFSSSWPHFLLVNEWIYCCSICFYPIFRAVHVISQDLIVFPGYVCPSSKLMTEDFGFDHRTNINEQWRRKVFCFGCCMLLSYYESSNPIIKNYRHSKKVVILNPERVGFGLASVIKSKFLMSEDIRSGTLDRLLSDLRYQRFMYINRC